MAFRNTSLLLTLVMLSACRPHDVSQLATDSVTRRIIGPAQFSETPEVADQAAVTGSLMATRALAWATFARTVKDVMVKSPRPDGTANEVAMPGVFTWYSPEDTFRLMGFGLGQLTNDKLDAGVPLTEGQWHAAEVDFNAEFDDLPAPLQKKWANFYSSTPVPETADLIGVTGLNRILFSPDLIGAVTSHYADLQDCFPGGVQPSAEETYRNCFGANLPRSSTLIKTTWLDTSFGFRKVATDAASLHAVMNSEASWDEVAVDAPVPDAIVKARSNGKTFVLGGMHIVSKELDDWLWLTAWWSDDPDHDFGEDRPAEVKALGAPWNQYKICAVSSHVQDVSELDAVAKAYPTLAAAYKEALGATGASWCSDPYIEKGANNPKTNCIGCHQFAGTATDQSEILTDSARFPNYGKTKQRTVFPTDYIWSATQGAQPWLANLNTIHYVQSP